MITFKNRNDLKNYSHLVSSLNIDFSYLSQSLGKLFEKENNEEENSVDKVRQLLKDIIGTAQDLDQTISLTQPSQDQ